MTRIAAKYFDGRQSRAEAVELSLQADGTIRPEPALFDPIPARDLRIQSRVGNTPRLITLPSGAALETTDHDPLDRWWMLHGGRTSGVHAFESRLGWVLAAVVSVFVLFIGGAVWGVPWASGIVARALPPAAVARLGEGSMDILDRVALGSTSLKPARQAELTQLFESLTAGDDGAYNFRLEFRAGGIFGANALALPDGTVVVTDELVELSGHDDELAAVMLHEIGHVVHRHGARRVIAHAGLAALTAALFGDVSVSASLVFALPNVLLESAYSRAMEEEADEYALTRMDALGVSLEHFAAFFERMAEKRGNAEPPGYVSSHPPTEERIRRILERADGD